MLTEIERRKKRRTKRLGGKEVWVGRGVCMYVYVMRLLRMRFVCAQARQPILRLFGEIWHERVGESAWLYAEFEQSCELADEIFCLGNACLMQTW